MTARHCVPGRTDLRVHALPKSDAEALWLCWQKPAIAVLLKPTLGTLGILPGAQAHAESACIEIAQCNFTRKLVNDNSRKLHRASCRDIHA